jgi:hypothetical protein
MNSEAYVRHGNNEMPMDKITRYGWTKRNEPGELRWLPKDLLQVPSDSYQRDPEKRTPMIRRIASAFDWMAFGVLSVARRNGEYFVFDGAGRLSAAKRRADIETVPCVVFDVDSVQSEASAFRSSNTERRGVSALDKFRAALVEGDPIARAVKAEVERLGLRIYDNSSDPMGINCIAWCMAALGRDHDRFVRVMNLAVRIPRDQGLTKDLLQAIEYAVRNLPMSQQSRFASRLVDFSAEQLIRKITKAKHLYGQGGEKVCGIGLVEALNHNLRNKMSLEVGA